MLLRAAERYRVLFGAYPGPYLLPSSYTCTVLADCGTDRLNGALSLYKCYECPVLIWAMVLPGSTQPMEDGDVDRYKEVSAVVPVAWGQYKEDSTTGSAVAGATKGWLLASHVLLVV